MKKPELTVVPPRTAIRPTLRTVAEACGLAVTTVSRALNDGEDIALRTRERVKRVANELGYVPNRAGLGLRTGRTQVLSLVLAPHALITGYTASIIAGMSAVCRDTGYELVATPDLAEQDELAVVKSVVENRRADGIVLSRTKPQDLRVRYLLEQGFPFVTHGRTELATPHATVDFDNQRFAELGVNRLVELGRKRLMLLGAPSELAWHNHLLTGFERAVARSGVELFVPADSFDLETPLVELRQAIAGLYENPDTAPDGIVCAGEMATLATMAGIRDAGCLPGHHVDLIAKQTSATLDHVVPTVESYFEDIVLTGRLLGESLLSVINQTRPLRELNCLVTPERRCR